MTQPIQKLAALSLAVILAAGLSACGAHAPADDGWQVAPPTDGWLADAATATEEETATTGASETTTATASETTGSTATSTAASSTTAKKTTKRTTRTTKAAAPADDPQRPKEEAEEGSPSATPSTLPDVTLPPSTTTDTTVATTTTSASSDSQPPSSTTSAATTTTTAAPPDTGWYTAGGKTYYYLNGKKLTGYQDIGKARYYFDAGGVLSSKVGIDVSTYQGDIDWKKVKADGVDFAIIRVGARGWGTEGKMFIDAKFTQNIKGATAAGVDRGVYFFSQAVNEAEAREEARYVLDAVKGYTLTYPIVFDTEYVNNADARTNKAGLTKAKRTDIAIAFCKAIRDAGYYPMVYSDKNWLTNYLDSNRLKSAGYDIWLAQYNSTVTYAYPYKMWQYTSSGSVDGIVGNVDRNVGLVDYAKLIRDLGLNKR